MILFYQMQHFQLGLSVETESAGCTQYISLSGQIYLITCFQSLAYFVGHNSESSTGKNIVLVQS